MGNTINVDYVVIKAPIEWFRTYHKILELLACWGERKVINPNCKCSGSSNIIIEAYELYQSAVAAYNLDEKTEGQKIIDYIDSLLEGYESAESFIVTIDGVRYLFTKNDIIEIDPDYTESDYPSYDDDSSESDTVNDTQSTSYAYEVEDESDSESSNDSNIEDNYDSGENADIEDGR